MTRDEFRRRVADLKARHAYLFAGEHIGHTIAPGWLRIVEELCARIDEALTEAEKPLVRFMQIKEKLGGLRCYLNVEPPRLDLILVDGVASFRGLDSKEPGFRLFLHLARFVQDAEEKSYQTCLFCGAPGRLRTEDRGWILTLCDRHAPYDYRNLDVGFELLTVPDRDLPQLALSETAALLLKERSQLRDLGAAHLGLLPSWKIGQPIQLVVEVADGSRSMAIDICREAIQRTGCLLDAVDRAWLRPEYEYASEADVTWVF